MPKRNESSSVLHLWSNPRSLLLPYHTRDALISGDLIPDFEFDQILPSNMREISDSQWSSVKAAKALSAMLCDRPKARFVDLGSGAGKMCLLLALKSTLEITGVERRQSLIDVARKICDLNAPGRINLLHMDLLNLDWRDYDVLYLFNPFFEHKCKSDALIDWNIELGERAFRRSVVSAFDKLSTLRTGQRVVTFHGYGGKMPKSLKLINRTIVDDGTMNMWERV